MRIMHMLRLCCVVITMDATKLDLPSESFDVVIDKGEVSPHLILAPSLLLFSGLKVSFLLSCLPPRNIGCHPLWNR